MTVSYRFLGFMLTKKRWSLIAMKNRQNGFIFNQIASNLNFETPH